MDVDTLKSITEEQIKMMMMMHMDKHPDDFSEHNHSEVTEFPLIEFYCGLATTPPNNSNILTHSDILDQNPNLSSPPTFLNHPPPLSSLGSSSNTVHHQDPVPPLSSLPNTPADMVSKSRLRHHTNEFSDTTSFPYHSSNNKKNPSMAAMREMIFRVASMQPIHIDPESVKPPKRRNVKISKDPQSVAARHRRERISEKIRILQRLVPGGTKMDTASMLDEAIHYVKFLKSQVQSLEKVAVNSPNGRPESSLGYTGISSNPYLSSSAKSYQYLPANFPVFNPTQMLK